MRGDQEVNPDDWEEIEIELEHGVEVSEFDLDVSMTLVPGTHVFFCKKGSHFGVCWGLLEKCPNGCHEGAVYMNWN
jgi:hypothetical protein